MLEGVNFRPRPRHPWTDRVYGLSRRRRMWPASMSEGRSPSENGPYRDLRIRVMNTPKGQPTPPCRGELTRTSDTAHPLPVARRSRARFPCPWLPSGAGRSPDPRPPPRAGRTPVTRWGEDAGLHEAHNDHRRLGGRIPRRVPPNGVRCWGAPLPPGGAATEVTHGPASGSGRQHHRPGGRRQLSDPWFLMGSDPSSPMPDGVSSARMSAWATGRRGHGRTRRTHPCDERPGRRAASMRGS